MIRLREFENSVMKDHLHTFVHLVLFICYTRSVAGDKRQDVSCRVSPFGTESSYVSFSEGTALENEVCTSCGDKHHKQLCFPHEAGHSTTWKPDNLAAQQGRPILDKGDSNRSKPTVAPKMEIKKLSSSKKLKGSKRQRKKEKKKKVRKKEEERLNDKVHGCLLKTSGLV